MLEHTPGEWKVRWLNGNMAERELFVQAPRLAPHHAYDVEILADDHGGENYPTERKIADAYLVSAAPNMLKALNEFPKLFERESFENYLDRLDNWALKYQIPAMVKAKPGPQAIEAARLEATR